MRAQLAKKELHKKKWVFSPLFCEKLNDYNEPKKFYQKSKNSTKSPQILPKVKQNRPKKKNQEYIGCPGGLLEAICESNTSFFEDKCDFRVHARASEKFCKRYP